VIKDPTSDNNGVWQLIAGAADWTYFSDNLDFIDETEMNTAVGEAVKEETENRDGAITAAVKTTLADEASSDTPPAAGSPLTFAGLLQTIRNNIKWLFANKVDKNGTDRLMTAAEGEKLADIQATGIIPLTVGLYTERAVTLCDIYLRDDNFTFDFVNNHLVAYLKSGFVCINGYLQIGDSPAVPLYFGANKTIITIGNTAYKPAPKIDYIGTVGDYHSAIGNADLSRLEMVRCENGSNDIKLGQLAQSAAHKPFLNYILLNIMYPTG
jgi:hypothetical protein